jgi:hypothetical protein
MATQLRRTDNARLEYMLNRLESKIEEGDEKAILTAERLLARRAKLMGLDMQPKEGDSGDSAAELLGMAMRELEQEEEELRVAEAKVVSVKSITLNGNGKKNGAAKNGKPKKKAKRKKPPGKNGKP